MRVDNHTYYYFSTDGNILRHFAILGQYGTIVINILLARVNYVPTLFFLLILAEIGAAGLIYF